MPVTENERAGIASRLYEAAGQRASVLGFELADDASQAVRTKANEAVGEIVERAESQRTPLEPHIEIAETSFRRLADAMISAAGGRRELTGQNFQAALFSICPIWPICRERPNA